MNREDLRPPGEVAELLKDHTVHRVKRGETVILTTDHDLCNAHCMRFPLLDLPDGGKICGQCESVAIPLTEYQND